MELKPSGNKLRQVEKEILHNEIIKTEKHYEELKSKSIVPFIFDKPYKHAFIYTLYGNDSYLTYLRYSIMSLRLAMPDAKIMVFAESKIWKKAQQELKHLMYEHDIVFVNGETACYKQVIACHTLLKDYTWCTFVDADLFFLAKPKTDGLRTALRKVKIHLDKCPKSFVWAFSREEKPNISHTFMHKRGRELTVRPHTYAWDLEEETGVNIPEIIEKNKVWNISYIFSFSPKSLQTDEYKAWALYSLLDNNHCDESIWYIWSLKKNWSSNYWSECKGLSISSTTHESDENIHLFQPMFTDTLDKKIHRRPETFLAIIEIEDKYREFINGRLQQQQV